MIPDHMSDSSWCMSDKQDHAPLCQALGFQSTLWDYYGRPENATFQARFNAAMTEVGKLHPPRSILEGRFISQIHSMHIILIMLQDFPGQSWLLIVPSSMSVVVWV